MNYDGNSLNDYIFQHAEIEKTYYPEIMINLIAQVLEHQVLHSQ